MFTGPTSRLAVSPLVFSLILLAPAAVAQERRAGELKLTPRVFTAAGGTRIQAEIGSLSVPENRSKPDSRIISLAVGRLKSTADEPRAPLVYLAGGPGSAATSIAKNPQLLRAWASFLPICDVILMDQRGTGLSKPNLRYQSENADPAPIFLSEAAARKYIVATAGAAAAHFRAKDVDLTGYTTVESADDLNDLRRSLGVDKISLIGFSYGTHLALETIRRHGRHLESVVAVGTAGPNHMNKLPSEIDTSFRKLAALASRDPRVKDKVPDMFALMCRVLDKLEQEPLHVQVRDPGGADVDVAVGRVGLQLILLLDCGDTNDFPVFPRLLWAIDRGDPGVLRWFVQKRWTGLRGLSAMTMLMRGASGATPERWARIRAEAERSPFGDARNFLFNEPRQALGTPDLGDEFRSPVVSDVRTLFVSGTLDANTPPYQAEEVRWGFTNSTHLIVENAGHEDMLPHPEVRQAIHRFIAGEDVRNVHITLPVPKFVPIEGYDVRITHPSVPRR